ncbi:MAG TPA: NAD(P)H-hydrate epimerase [Symbiobacteriaceae bacterium]|jgi:NAD(P)H-hydrate epimerase
MPTDEPLTGVEIPALTGEEMREVDRLMMEEAGIALLQMMELAGHHLARLAQQLARDLGGVESLVVLAGRGNNGGGGLVAARHLQRWGLPVHVVLSAPAGTYAGVPGHQLHTLRQMGVFISTEPPLPSTLPQGALVLDALVGYGLTGPVQGATAELIEWTTRSRLPVLALDAPSGLDVTSGAPCGPCIRARATLTLALPKIGLMGPVAAPFVGDLYLADIGIPESVYRRLGLSVGPLFAETDILRIRLPEKQRNHSGS